MDETTEAPTTDDFGASLRRRLRAYGTGVLGSQGAEADGPAINNQATSPVSGIVARTAAFDSSLQSLLSYRQVARLATDRPAMPTQAPATAPSDVAPAASAAGDDARRPFGTVPRDDEWFKRMQTRVR